MNSKRTNCFILFFTSLLLTLAFVYFTPTVQPYGDSPGYLELSRNVSLGHGFTEDGVNPAVYRPPLFSFLLGLWFLIIGSQSLLVSSLFQCLVYSVGSVFVFLLFDELWGSRKGAFWGALAVSCNPFLFVHVVFVLQEPLLMAVTTLALWLTIRWFNNQTLFRACICGLGWGIATLGKAVTWYVPFLLLVLSALSHLKPQWRWGLSWRQVIILSTVFVGSIAPWSIRNYRHFHRFILVNDQANGMLEYVLTKGTLKSVGGVEFQKELDKTGLSPEEKKKEIWSFILKHKAVGFHQVVKNFIWFPLCYTEWFGHVAGFSKKLQVWIWPALLFHGPLYLGFFYCGLLAWREKRADDLFAFIFYLIYWFEYGVYWGRPRFAVPVFPVLFFLGICGLGRIWKSPTHLKS
ncbi:MAG: glycosyltransferase family 39 protein [Elusimicrobia bacterium]|nr:glycosyltransferase family 39 protein [Candidatus Obscuribacterium magneticum]